jgi:putative N6-adenine-specific DNA methylase
MYNGALECELRQYTIFEGDKKSFLAAGGKLKRGKSEEERSDRRDSKHSDKRSDRRSDRRSERRDDRRPARKFSERTDRAQRQDSSVENTEIENENPLAKRRNPGALKSILVGRTPSLPNDGKPIMRSRGWKKK